MPRRLASALAVAVLLLLAVLVPARAEGADVHGDDAADAYVGTGGLVLPGSVDEPTRQQVAGCADCRWRLTSPCIESAAGTAFDGQAVCSSVVRGCPAMERLLRAWFAPAGGSWREIGLVCIGRGGPVTVARAGEQVRERFAREVPDVAGRAQPARGVVAQLPVVFDSGQSGAVVDVRTQVAGEDVALRAAPRWRWDFGDGASLTTDHPGGRYPDLAVSHVYRFAGDYRVRLTTTWSARFTVDGLGPFPVTEPVTQEESVGVRVGEGRALLAVR